MLRDTLISITEQRRLPDEVIVVNNNSSDNTEGVVKSFEGKLNIKHMKVLE